MTEPRGQAAPLYTGHSVPELNAHSSPVGHSSDYPVQAPEAQPAKAPRASRPDHAVGRCRVLNPRSLGFAWARGPGGGAGIPPEQPHLDHTCLTNFDHTVHTCLTTPVWPRLFVHACLAAPCLVTPVRLGPACPGRPALPLSDCLGWSHAARLTSLTQIGQQTIHPALLRGDSSHSWHAL